MDVRLVRRVSAATGCAVVAVDAQGENQILVASGANALARAANVPEALLAPHTTLLLEREVEALESAALARRAKARGARVILNLAPMGPVPEELLAASDFLVVNEHEAATLLGGETAGASAAAAFAARRGITLIVTLGAEGAMAHSPDGSGLRVAALPVAPVDTDGGRRCLRRRARRSTRPRRGAPRGAAARERGGRARLPQGGRPKCDAHGRGDRGGACEARTGDGARETRGKAPDAIGHSSIARRSWQPVPALPLSDVGG